MTGKSTTYYALPASAPYREVILSSKKLLRLPAITVSKVRVMYLTYVDSQTFF
jgi:hypothetical protein